MPVYYTKDHEWILVDGEVATIGISDHAQEQLGDVVFVELPEVGRTFKAHEQAAVVESVKAASEIFAPIAGEVIERNQALEDGPGTVNEAAETAAWFFRLKIADPSELEGLMDRDAYDSFVESLD